MTLADIQNSIYRRTNTNANNFSNPNMVLAINSANRKVHALIKKVTNSNYRPTDWTSAELGTGTAVPVFEYNFHELLALWASYEYMTENNFDKTAIDGVRTEIQDLEILLVDFYGRRNYYVATVTIASPGVFTIDNHGLFVGDRVSLVTSGSLPTGLSVDTFYYVIANGLTQHEFQVATTRTGSAINTSGSQSGTHWLFTEKQPRIVPGYITRGDSSR